MIDATEWYVVLAGALWGLVFQLPINFVVADLQSRVAKLEDEINKIRTELHEVVDNQTT